MRKQFTVVDFLILCLLTILFLDQTSAQDEIPDFGDGLFEQASEKMNALLRFGVVNNRLRIERGWDLASARKKVDEEPKSELEAAIQRRIDQGFDRDFAERLANNKRGPFGVPNDTRNSGLNIAFGKYLQTFGSKSGGGFSSSDGNFRSHHSGRDFSASVQYSDGDLRFEFAELDDAGRRLSVCESEYSKLILNFTADDLLVDLRQQANGRVRLAIVGEESAKLYQASDFATLIVEHPKPVSNILYPLLNQLGIQKPVSDSDPEVRDAVIKRLFAGANDDMHVVALVDQLESDSFDSRDEATKELRQNYFLWQELIKKKTADKTYSDEIKQRLKKITEGWPADEIHDFIQINDLVGSPPYLIRLMETAIPADKAVIIQRLVEVTGEELGEDVEEWKAWLKSSEK